MRPEKATRLGVLSMLVALAIVLHAFNLPYPPASFLLFDLSGVPLAVAAVLFPREAFAAGLPAFYLGLLIYRPQDPIGPFMKVAAEAATMLPLVYLYEGGWFRGRWRRFAATALVALSRVGAMAALNLAIDPFYFLLFKWVDDYSKGLFLTLLFLPHVAAFNAITALYVTWLSVPIARELERAGVAGAREGAES